MSQPLPVSDLTADPPAEPEASGNFARQQDQAWARLMQLAQGGDSASYRRLLTEITPYLRALARRQHSDFRDVEDSVQDILLTLHSVRHTYDPVRPFKPWLVAIGRRRIIDRLRANRRTRLRETELSREHETFSADETNIHETESEGRLLRDAVESLPAGQREAIRLLKLEGKSLKQAAAESGMSVAALKVAVHRAVKSLRKMMERRADKS